MIKATLDTNVIISAIIFHGKPEQILKLAEEKSIELIISPSILSEVKKVLAIKFERDESETKRALKWLMNVGKIVNPSREIKTVAYKPDNRILECALEAKADYIITDDKKHLLPLKKFEGIKIATASDFLKIIQEN